MQGTEIVQIYTYIYAIIYIFTLNYLYWLLHPIAAWHD